MDRIAEVANVVAAGLLGFLLGMAIMASSWRRDAVRHGAARWAIDRSGAARFEWRNQ